MTNYTSNATVKEVATRLKKAKSVFVTTHARPDADGLGAALAIARALATQSTKVDVVIVGPLEKNLRPLIGDTNVQLVDEFQTNQTYDLGVIVDTGAWTQLEKVSSWLRTNYDKLVVIDHHAMGDEDVAPLRLVRPQAVSTTAILVSVFDEMKCELTGGVGGIAEPLFAGIATDCGWFRFANANAEAFSLAARLLECGVDKDRLYRMLEETYGPERIALQSRALASVEYLCDGTVAIQSLRESDFKETGATSDELTNLVNGPLAVDSVQLAILLTEIETGVTKISFRTKPGAVGDATKLPDANALAQKFGGGGHKHAAGARVKKNLDEVKAGIVAELQSAC